MSQQDPFYDVPKTPVLAPTLSIEAIRAMVREEVRKALNEIITEIRLQTSTRE